MRKRLISMLSALILILGLLPGTAFAASTPEEALGEVDIYSGGYSMRYLAVNGRVQTQSYTYFLYEDRNGETLEIPAYCVTPNQYGVPQTVPEGESIEYLAEERASDPKIVGLVANMYPHRSLAELGVANKYQAFYAGKIALWCYLIPEWDISAVTVAPGLTGTEREIGENILNAAVKIYTEGTRWTSVADPQLTTSPDQETAYPVTIDGTAYRQQVFTVTSPTWVDGRAISVSFQEGADVPEGTRIVDENNQDITQVTVSNTGDGYKGIFKVLYPEDSVAGQNGSVQLTLSADVYQYAVYYALCQEKDQYGNLQSYLCDTDPKVSLLRNAISNYTSEPEGEPDPEETALKITKYEAGTTVTLSGATFEVVGPDGDTIGVYTTPESGSITIPLTEVGNYTIYERVPPEYHLLDEEPVKQVTVRYGEVAEVDFANEPYGDLRIEKIDGATGASLAGAKVQIKHIESGAVYTGTTDTGGSYTFTELQPGAYEILELAAPEGWERDPQTYTTTVFTGDCVEYTIKNEALPGLKIIKYDRESHETMSGVTFRIWRDGELLGDYETDTLGEITLTDCQPGTYRVQEVDTGDSGHVLDTTPQEIELKAGDGIKELYFFNDLKPGIWLVKVDSADPSKVIPNAKFRIEAVDGSWGPAEFTTDQNGEIDLSELPTGAYVVAELECPGYIIDEAQRIIQLEANQTARFVFTNSIQPSLHLIKLSSDGSRLAGVTFRIAKIEDGSRYLDSTTDENGEILISGLEPGVYSVKELDTVSDHIIDPVERHVELFAGRISTIILENDIRPNLYIHKTDADTGAPIPGTVYLVRGADGHSIAEVETGPDGVAVVENLLPGVVEVIEKSVPEPYLLAEDSQTVTLYPNRDRDVYFQNYKRPVIEIIKENEVTHDPIENVPFQVWYASNNTSTGEYNDLGVYYTDEEGRIVLSAPELSLRDGWFRVKELEPAPGFALADPDTQEAFIAAGEGHTFRFTNRPLSAICVWKYDSETGAAIEGAVFQVRYLSGNTSGTGGTVIGTYRTSVNGSFTVTGCKSGTYIIEELSSDGSHVIDTPPQTVYLSGEEQEVVQIYFGNAPKGALLVTKVSADGEKTPLSDVEFLVTTSDGAVVGDANGKFVTDSSGSFLVEGIEPGTTLVVRETRAKPGYLLDDTPQTAEIQAGQTVTLEFRNQTQGNLIVHKLSSVDKSPLEGAQFKITYADGSYLPDENGQLSSNGLYWTNSEGQIVLSGITGTVIATEVQAPSGYTIDSNTQSQTVVVNPNDTQELYFYNTPLAALTILKRSSADRQPLAGAEFLVTDGAGTPIGPNSGRYTSNSDGLVTVSGLEPGQTVIAREVSAPDGFQLDGTPQSIVIREDSPNQLVFENAPLGNLIIHKLDSVTKEPLEDVQFKITYSDGSFVDAEGGKLSSNGLYWTNSEGQIALSNVTGTLVVTEVQSIEGYTIDPNTQSQTVVVRADDTQELWFYNDPVGGLELIKVNESKISERIPNTTFEIRRMDDALVDTITTDRNGRAFLALEDGSYYAVEVEANSDFILDSTPHYFEIKGGNVYTLRVTNAEKSGILIHKVDQNGEGIYGVKFLLYDANRNPIGEFVSDNSGYVHITADDLPNGANTSGRFYLRELEVPDGYIIDTETKTVYVRPGHTAEIEWVNAAITAQIQIWKKSADDNPINGFPAGTPLEGAVFEIYNKANVLVDTIESNSRGLAVSKPLPLGRYIIKEVSSPQFYSVNSEEVTVYLEHEGQIVQLEWLNESVYTNVSIGKSGYTQVVPGQEIRYTFKDIGNNSTVPLSNFYWRDTLPTDAVRLDKIITGTYSARLNYKIVYQTNLNNTQRVLADNLNSQQNYTLDASAAALGLASNEYVTQVTFLFGQVPAGFKQVETPYIYCDVLSGLAHEYRFANKCDVGGMWQNQWIQATDRWVTIIYRGGPTPTLPRTGY